AIEDKRVAATRIADRHDKNWPLEVARKLVGRSVGGVDRIESVGLSREASGEQGMVARERVGVVDVPSGAEASAEHAVLLAEQRRRRQAEGLHRLVHHE